MIVTALLHFTFYTRQQRIINMNLKLQSVSHWIYMPPFPYGQSHINNIIVYIILGAQCCVKYKDNKINELETQQALH